MKHSLSDEEREVLDRKISEAEQCTGAQIVLAVVEKSDIYAEIPWKAFALGTSLGGLLVLLMNLKGPLSSPLQAAFLAVVLTLAAGAGFALLSVFVPDFARLFLFAHRAEVETLQYARSLFLSRELFATRERRTVLLMISLLERRIVVLPDKGLAADISEEAVHKVIDSMRPELVEGRTAQAFLAGLKSLEAMIDKTGCSGSPEDALPNEIIEEKGP